MEDIKISNLNKEDFKSDGIAKVIENSLNSKTNREAFKIIHSLREKGCSFQSVADELNERGVKTRRGKTYFRSSAKNLYDRFLKYYDPELEKFKEGIVEIESSKAKHFGNLKVADDGSVVIETNYTQFKSFIFIEKEAHLFQKKALEHLNKAFLFADNRILVSNLLHIKKKPKQNFLPNTYFTSLESIITGKDLEYIRALQIPWTIWKPILEKDVVPDPELPIESIIVASSLLSQKLFNHIRSCILNIGNKFKLYIYKIQRPHSTFATIDDRILIEEEHMSDIGGYVSTTGIKIYRTNDINDDIGKLIRSRSNSFYHVWFSERNPFYENPIDTSLFLSLALVTRELDNIMNFSDFIVLSRKHGLYKSLDQQKYPPENIFRLIKSIKNAIDSYREDINQYSSYQAYKNSSTIIYNESSDGVLH